MGDSSITAPEVSVIVAFYNVEKYVRHCIDSLLAQDFDDYEVVCVDDGSTDNTPDILDEYEGRDIRIHVVHKHNGGLSDARNTGVKASRGKLIAFVDGDDVVSPDYISSMWNAMGDRHDCMVIARVRTITFEDVSKGEIKWRGTYATYDYDRAEVLRHLLYDNIQPCAYAKLSPRSVYEQTPFPLGARYEEIRTIVSFIQSVHSYVLLDKEIYGYVMRDGSITWSRTASVEQLSQYRCAIDTICGESSKEFGVSKQAIAYQRALLDTRAHSQLPPGARRNAGVRAIDDALLSDLRKTIPIVLADSDARISSKLRFIMLVCMRPVYDVVYGVFRRRVKKVS